MKKKLRKKKKVDKRKKQRTVNRRKRRARRSKNKKEEEKSRDERYKGKKAKDIISEEKAGKINKEFPEEFKDKTWEEINKAAKEGDRKARKAKKLLGDGRFDK